MTINDITLLGDRVLIQLHEEPAPVQGSIYIPLMDFQETDGGKIIAKASDRKYLSVGTILSCSKKAEQSLLDNDLKFGDKVVLSTQALSTSTYQFFLDKEILSPRYTGLICVPAILIEAKIN